MILPKQLINLVFTIILFTSTTIWAQEEKVKQNDAEYVLELIYQTSTTEVHILALNYDYNYTKDWLANVKVRANYIVFKNGNRIHSWNLDDVILINKSGTALKISLSNSIGK